MTQTYPFTRGAPGGIDLLDGQKLPAAAFNTADKNAAQAADGLIWSDVAALRNFRKITAPGLANVDSNRVVYDTTNKRWLFFAGGNPQAFFSHDGLDDWIALGSVPSGTNWDSPSAGAANGAVHLIGGTMSGSSAGKIRESHDSGATWAVRNTVASASEAVWAMSWFPLASLFVIGLSSAASTNIETSPDGQTWTQRTGLPNTSARSALACNNSIIIAACKGSNKCLRSTNATTWTEGTMPSAEAWSDVTWWEQGGKFIMIANGAIATSDDNGLTWTSSGMTAPFTTAGGIATFGRLWIASGITSSKNAIAVSVDSGYTWSRVKSLSGTPGQVAAGDGQILAYATGGLFASLRVGL